MHLRNSKGKRVHGKGWREETEREKWCNYVLISKTKLTLNSKLGMAVRACNASAEEAEAEGSQVQGQPRLQHSAFQTSLRAEQPHRDPTFKERMNWIQVSLLLKGQSVNMDIQAFTYLSYVDEVQGPCSQSLERFHKATYGKTSVTCNTAEKRYWIFSIANLWNRWVSSSFIGVSLTTTVRCMLIFRNFSLTGQEEPETGWDQLQISGSPLMLQIQLLYCHPWPWALFCHLLWAITY